MADGLLWSRDRLAVRLHSTPAPDRLDAAAGQLSYDLELAPGQSQTVLLTCTAAHTDGDQFPAPPAGQVPWSVPVLRSADRRLGRWLEQSLADLDRLRLTDPLSGDHAASPADQFLAAGAPWYLTLFGRDAIWAARMLLPWGTDLAAGTLRTLARRQGAVADPTAEEQPGKILHQVRRTTQQFSDTLVLPLYYGTVDATPLWITLLHDAWRWGLAPKDVEQLLPHAESALAWMREQSAADGDGFLKYIDQTGQGLANQGWKDHGDSIRHRDGGLAEPPIALWEVQAYAYEAAIGGAALLRAFDRPGAVAWEEWAEQLADRFRKRFWVQDAHGPYPAVALNRDGRPVDSVTSGFGHLLGTGILNREESALLAARLTAPDLDSGHGLRTLSSISGGFNPYGYHTGSVWPHDTAIARHGLVRAGFPRAAAALAAGLLDASAHFDARLPELFAGHSAEAGARPAPYPASCRPQAWAAASSVLVLQAALGLDADVPGGTVTVAPTFADEYGPLTVTGLRVAADPLEVTIAADGAASAVTPEGMTVVIDHHDQQRPAFLKASWDAEDLRTVIDNSLAPLQTRGNASHPGAVQPRCHVPHQPQTRGVTCGDGVVPCDMPRAGRQRRSGGPALGVVCQLAMSCRSLSAAIDSSVKSCDTTLQSRRGSCSAPTYGRPASMLPTGNPRCSRRRRTLWRSSLSTARN